jgi:phosphate/sulfate permease
MSEGGGHDMGVMIKSISTLDWQNESIRKLQLRRVSLSKFVKRDARSEQLNPQDNSILRGIDFQARGRQRTKSRLPLDPPTEPSKPKKHHGSSDEPLWVSVMGGAGLFLGIVTIWILS